MLLAVLTGPDWSAEVGEADWIVERLKPFDLAVSPESANNGAVTPEDASLTLTAIFGGDGHGSGPSDPFRDIDRIAQQVWGMRNGSRSLAMPMDAYRKGTRS